MTTTQRGIGIKGRLARDPVFYPGKDGKEATTYLRLLDDEWRVVGKDSDDNPVFESETIGRDLEIRGTLAETIATTRHKGDYLIAIADRDDWQNTRNGTTYDNVTYHVKAIGDVITPARRKEPTDAAAAPTQEVPAENEKGPAPAEVYRDPAAVKFGPASTETTSDLARETAAAAI